MPNFGEMTKLEAPPAAREIDRFLREKMRPKRSILHYTEEFYCLLGPRRPERARPINACAESESDFGRAQCTMHSHFYPRKSRSYDLRRFRGDRAACINEASHSFNFTLRGSNFHKVSSAPADIDFQLNLVQTSMFGRGEFCITANTILADG
jgi:hypothetical protein